MILAYHNIASESGFNTLALKHFVGQLEVLLGDKKHQIVPLHDYVDHLRRTPERARIAITFDDAYVSIEEFVLPLIKKYGIPITVFVPVYFVGAVNDWDKPRNYLSVLNWDQIRQLNQEPLITFGSHGCAHQCMAALNEKDQWHELHSSKTILERELNTPVDYFAYPFGQLRHIGSNTNLLLQHCGYKAALTTRWKQYNTIEDVYALHRLNIDSHFTPHTFHSFLNAPFDWRASKQKIKNCRDQIFHR